MSNFIDKLRLIDVRALIALFLLFLIYVPKTAGNTIRERAYASFISGDFNQFKVIIVEIQKKKTLTIPETIQLLDYQYNYIAYLLREKRKSEAEVVINQFGLTLQLLEKYSPTSPELWAFKAYNVAYTLRLAPLKAPFIASDAKKYIHKSITLSPQSPWGYFASGNNYLYAPEAFGGNKKEAIKAFAKAVSLFEAKPIAKFDFEYLHCLRMLAEAYKIVGDYDQSILICKKILSIEPAYQLVREKLLVDVVRLKTKK